MSLTQSDYLAALPEISLLGLASFVLLMDLFMGKRCRHMTTFLPLIALAITFAVVLKQAIGLFSGELVAHTAFNNFFIMDKMSALAKLFVLLNGAFIFVYSRTYFTGRDLPQAEFINLGLFSLLGMMVMISSNHFLTLYLGLELLSLPLYAMVALQRDLPVSSEAAMKYFVMGAIASAMLLYGISMVYGAAQTLNFTEVAQFASQEGALSNTVLVFGLVFIVAGLAFKLGAVPFHMWVPDVYQGAPTLITMFISTAPKIAAVVMTLRVLTQALPDLIIQWQMMLTFLAILSITLGNILAIAQANIKRMLAFSAIAHMGYMMLGIISGEAAGYGASLFYVLMYSVMSLGAFGFLTLLSCEGRDVELIEDLSGLNSRQPWLAFMLLILMFSMAGIPPTVGFFAKLGVLKALVDSGQTVFAVYAMLMALVGAYYYLRIIRVMYFQNPVGKGEITVSRDGRVLLSVNSLTVLALGVVPMGLIALCQMAFGV